MRYLRVCTTGLQNPMLRDASEHRRGGITLPRQAITRVMAAVSRMASTVGVGGDYSRLPLGTREGLRTRSPLSGQAAQAVRIFSSDIPGRLYLDICHLDGNWLTFSGVLPGPGTFSIIQRGDSNPCGLCPRVFESASVRISQWGSGTQGGMVSTL